jgi:hypothetical protein
MEKTEENAEDIKSEIQQEIDDIKSKQTGNLEIEANLKSKRSNQNLKQKNMVKKLKKELENL